MKEEVISIIKSDKGTKQKFNSLLKIFMQIKNPNENLKKIFNLGFTEFRLGKLEAALINYFGIKKSDLKVSEDGNKEKDITAESNVAISEDESKENSEEVKVVAKKKTAKK